MKINCPECLRKENCNPDIHNGKCVSMRTDNIKAAYHRLYRGFILPAIVEAMGETNPNYVHGFILKPEWLTRAIGEPAYYYDSFNDMPEKYQTSGRTFKSDMGGYGHVPSMKTFTMKETKEYLKFCEHLLYIEISGHIPEDIQHEYKQAREDARI